MIAKIKKYLKENPFITVLLVVLLIGTAAYGIYQIIYSTNNARQQESYEKMWERSVTAFTIETDMQDDAVEKVPTVWDEFLAQGNNQVKYGNYLNENVMDFDVLWEYNKDIIGYIVIPGTKISYPILRSEDNSYYLNHNIDGSKGYPGCIYMESYNSPDFDDSITILYGHNMRNDTMFGTLDEYRKEEYRQENPYIIIYLPDEVCVYELVVASKYSDEHLLVDNFKQEADDTYTFTGLEGDENMNFMDAINDYGAYGAYIDLDKVEETDKLLVLSTCASDNMRYIIGAKRIL